LLYVLFDISFVHTLHLSSVMIASAFVVGLVAQKRAADVVLVCLFVIPVIGGLSVTNDHEEARAFVESLRN
jgi:hypothetical protein